VLAAQLGGPAWWWYPCAHEGAVFTCSTPPPVRQCDPRPQVTPVCAGSRTRPHCVTGLRGERAHASVMCTTDALERARCAPDEHGCHAGPVPGVQPSAARRHGRLQVRARACCAPVCLSPGRVPMCYQLAASHALVRLSPGHVSMCQQQAASHPRTLLSLTFAA